MQQLEKPLDDTFKKAPQLPENVRKGLANAMPWLTLAGGVLSLLAALSVYQIITQLNGVYQIFGYSNAVAGVNLLSWVTVFMLIAEAVLFFIAFPDLRLYRKKGWSLVFWASLVNVVYVVFSNLFNGGFVDVGQLIFMLIGTVVGVYLLFQIKDYYTTAGRAVPGVAEATEKPAEPAEPAEKTDKQA